MGCGGSKQATSRGGQDNLAAGAKLTKKEKAPIGNQQVVTGTPVVTGQPVEAQPTQMIVQ